MLTITTSSIGNLSFSNVYIITVTGMNGSNIVCTIDGDIDAFKHANEDKYTEIGTTSTQQVVTSAVPTTKSIEDIITDGVMRSVATSYGLQEGIKLWSAQITPYDKIAELPLSDFEKAAIIKHYPAYQSAVILPKYIAMVAGIAAAAWAYISPIIMPLIHTVI